MLRIIVRHQYAHMVPNASGAPCFAGGDPEVQFKTFDVDLPSLEAELADVGTNRFDHCVIGVEILPKKSRA